MSYRINSWHLYFTNDPLLVDRVILWCFSLPLSYSVLGGSLSSWRKVLRAFRPVPLCPNHIRLFLCPLIWRWFRPNNSFPHPRHVCHVCYYWSSSWGLHPTTSLVVLKHSSQVSEVTSVVEALWVYDRTKTRHWCLDLYTSFNSYLVEETIFVVGLPGRTYTENWIIISHLHPFCCRVKTQDRVDVGRDPGTRTKRGIRK